jgi:hypothetical protein
VKFDYTTRAQLLARIRERYRTATGETAAKCAVFLAAASDVELRSAFGVAQGQVASLKGRLQASAAKLKALRETVGE